MILINENSKKHWLSQCLHINIQVLHGGKLTLEGLTIMSEILMNCLKSLTMICLRLQLGMASFSLRALVWILRGLLYCLFYRDINTKEYGYPLSRGQM